MSLRGTLLRQPPGWAWIYIYALHSDLQCVLALYQSDIALVGDDLPRLHKGG